MQTTPLTRGLAERPSPRPFPGKPRTTNTAEGRPPADAQALSSSASAPGMEGLPFVLASAVVVLNLGGFLIALALHPGALDSCTAVATGGVQWTQRLLGVFGSLAPIAAALAYVRLRYAGQNRPPSALMPLATLVSVMVGCFWMFVMSPPAQCTALPTDASTLLTGASI